MNITVEDLLTDERFLAWYYQKDETQIRWWNEWIARDPVHGRLAREAICWLAMLQIEEGGLTEEEVRRAAEDFIRSLTDKKA